MRHGGPRKSATCVVRGVDIGLTDQHSSTTSAGSNERVGQFDDKIVYIAKLFTEEVHLVSTANYHLDCAAERPQGPPAAKGSGRVDRCGTSSCVRNRCQEVSIVSGRSHDTVKSGEIAATALMRASPVVESSSAARKGCILFAPLFPSSSRRTTCRPPHREDYPELRSVGNPGHGCGQCGLIGLT